MAAVTDGSDTFRVPDLPRSRFVGIPNEEENETEIFLGAAKLEQDLGDHWLATLSLNHSASNELSVAEHYAYGSYPNGDVGIYSVRINADLEGFSGELRLNGEFNLLGRPAQVVLGVDHAEVENLFSGAFNLFAFASDPGPPNIYSDNFADFPNPGRQPPNFTAKPKEVGTGAYAQLQFRPFERLSVLLGGRYDFVDSSYDISLSSSGPSIVKDEPEDFSGRIAVGFDVRKNITAYGLFAQSFDPVLNLGADGQILKPTTGEIFEAGIKTEWLDNRLGVNTAVFRLDRKDVPIDIGRNSAGQSIFRSAGLQRSDGIELEINGEPLPGWNLSFGGSLLDAKFLGDKNVDPNVGRTPDASADWQVGLFTSYELQSGPLRGLGAGVGLYAIDDRGVRNRDQKIPGYERVDLSFFYNGFKNTSIALQVRNVFDATYLEAVTVAGSGANFGSPLAALLTVRHEFGK